MKVIGLSLVTLIALYGQTPAPASAPVRHLVYEFGYNTKVASSGTGTGTLTVDISGPAPDGGMMVSGTDDWWNSARPRATNTCEVYASGTVSCSQRPYAISPIQVTLFPLLARGYFHGLSAQGTSTWKHSFAIKAAIIPGANGFAGTLYTWKCAFTLNGKGPIPKAAPFILIEAQGTLDQQGGRYFKATSKERIAYDPTAKIPVIVNDQRSYYPQRSVYNNDLVELKLKK